MRRPFIAGNWKMNLDLPAARALIAGIREQISGRPPVDIAVCPPAIYLFPMAKAVADTPIALGAQNCWHTAHGAFTGEIAAVMARETGCQYVILGHSERRHVIGPRDADGRVHGETDEMIAAKCRAVLETGMTPIVCVGETLEERDRGETEAVLTRQVAGGLAGVEGDAAGSIVIAYEPVWAIGTGRTATPEQAQEAHAHIRGRLAEQFGRGTADGIRIQYGGSVKPDNAVALLSCPDVDGALVGGASLKAADFVAIIEAGIRAKGLS
ncbi:MAG: triose-phosphate isomerase [Phycisphaerae bacterium]